MRVFFLNFRRFFFFAIFAAAPFAVAQDAGNTAKRPVEELELIDEGEQPTITIRKPDASREITERRGEGGAVSEIRVKTGISTYYLLPNNPLGSSFHDAASTVVRPALWRVHEFDMTGQKSDENRDESEIDYTSDAPAPPTPK